MYELKLEGFSIVALGAFNPVIFQPLWFSDNSLIRKEEAANAVIQIIHRNATIFSAEWFSLQVTDGQFSIESNDPTKSHPLRDLALGTFKILEHTPISAFGFNRNLHFAMSSNEEWHSFGHHLAPKTFWNDVLKDPGLLTMTMQGTVQGKEDPNKLNVRIEPSAKVPHGVFVSINQHYQLDPTKSIADSNRAFLKAVQSSWDDFFTYCVKIYQQLFSILQHGAK